jgi:hypothetical protein
MTGEGGGERGLQLRAKCGEAGETSGVTSALLLGYLDQAGGPEVVAEVLRRAGMERFEGELRDENSWFSWETKIAPFEATADVLQNPGFMTEMAAYGLDANIAGGLKVALRTLGSPQFVLRNIVGANARFTMRRLGRRALDQGQPQHCPEGSDRPSAPDHGAPPRSNG